MKKFYQKLSHVLTLESGDQRNPTEMKLRIWTFNGGTAILVLMTQCVQSWEGEFWDGKNNVSDVNNAILEILKSLGIIFNEKNWIYSKKYASLIKGQDFEEEKEKCRYFSWTLKTFPI